MVSLWSDFREWDEYDAHAASSMISPLAQRLAPEALHSIHNLASHNFEENRRGCPPLDFIKI